MYTQRSSNLWVQLLKECTNWFIMCLRCVKEHDNNWLQHIHWQAERKQVRDTADHKNDIKKIPGDEREWGGVTGWITALEECGYQVTACQKMVSYCILTHINYCVMHCWKGILYNERQCKAILQTYTSNGFIIIIITILSCIQFSKFNVRACRMCSRWFNCFVFCVFFDMLPYATPYWTESHDATCWKLAV